MENPKSQEIIPYQSGGDISPIGNIYSLGLTYEQKEALYSSKAYRMRNRDVCRCYSMGDGCKVHGVKYF